MTATITRKYQQRKTLPEPFEGLKLMEDLLYQMNSCAVDLQRQLRDHISAHEIHMSDAAHRLKLNLDLVSTYIENAITETNYYKTNYCKMILDREQLSEALRRLASDLEYAAKSVNDAITEVRKVKRYEAERAGLALIDDDAAE